MHPLHDLPLKGTVKLGRIGLTNPQYTRFTTGLEPHHLGGRSAECSLTWQCLRNTT